MYEGVRSVLLATLAGIGVIAFGCVLCDCTITRLHRAPTDKEITQLDPQGVLEVYWASALTGDSASIRKLVGPAGKRLIWDCPPPSPDPAADRFKLELEGNRSSESEYEELEKNEDAQKLESILRTARVIEIARQPLHEFYDISDRKISANEAKFVVRSKENPRSTSSLVFFIANNDSRWCLIDIVYVGDVDFLVGNKRFGEHRSCPNNN